MSTETEETAPASQPTPSEPVKLAEPTPRESVTGSGVLEKRASEFPVPQAQVTPLNDLLTGPGPLIGTPPPPPPEAPPASPAAESSTSGGDE